MVIETKTPSHIEPPSNMTYQDFAKLRVGSKVLDDATLDLGVLKKASRNLADKERILTAIDNGDYPYLREVSNFFYEASGIYGRLCRYLAYLYRYDWMVVPYVNSDSAKPEKVLTEFSKVLNYLDNMDTKMLFNDFALKVVKNGVYYGYRIDGDDKTIIQELPIPYCRSRYFVNGKPLVEFNVKFFDDSFKDANQRMNVLKSFPKEFVKGYAAFKAGRLKVEPGDQQGWIVLDPEFTLKFNVNGSEMPALMSVIPAIINLDEAQELDRKKMLQELLKIVIQKMPLDKNGDLIFDVDEAADLHNNAVQMLSKAVGVDVLTTFAEIEVANMADKNSSTTKDDLQKVERNVYNQAGVSRQVFDTDGNLALDKSIANDESAMYNLLLQFEKFLNDCLDYNFNKNPKKLKFRVNMLTTTIYNFKELAKLYKEQATLGYSKMLPQIALGQSQSSILATAHFENEVLQLAEIMIPLQSSNTMSGDPKARAQETKAPTKEAKPASDNKGGRPEKEDAQKSEKTIQNKESMS